MSSSQLALELLSLSAGISQFSNFQLINLGQQNNLFNIAPELIQFISTCGACDNRLASLFSSNLNINPLLLNLGQCNGCLTQLNDLQGLFLSGFDANGFANNDNNNNNNTENINNANNETAVDDGQQEGEDEGDANVDDENAAAANETAVAEGEAAANETAVDEGEGEAAANETEVADEKDGKEKKKAKQEETPSSEGRKAKRTLVQRSGAAKVSKVQVLGSVGFGLVMLVGAVAL